MKKPTQKKSEIPVYCSHTEMVDIAKINPHPRNPNKHPESQIKLLAKIIKQGWRAPITVSNRSGFIIKGHARLAAAKLLGVNQAPVDLQDYKNEAEEYADLLADNRLSELAEMDLSSLKDLLEELDTGAFDTDLTGYDEKAIEELMTQFYVERPEDFSRAATSPWERVGEASDGVVFAFGEIQKRLPGKLYERFKEKITLENIEDKLNEMCCN